MNAHARCALVLALLALAGPAAADSPPASPYAGFERRPIKALSDDQLADLRDGRGMMLSLPAELNGYPGPRHMLDMADALHLSAEQRAAVAALVPAMTAEAKAVGARIIEGETALNRLFAHRGADEVEVRQAANEVAARWGELRFVHLKYHLRAAALLSPDQIARYDALRGYAGGDGATMHQHKH